MEAVLIDSGRAGKRYAVRIGTKTIHFGSEHDSFPFHKDPARRERYLQRHRAREDWTRSGVETPGFYARWVLWEKPTIAASLREIQRRFGLRIKDERRKKEP